MLALLRVKELSMKSKKTVEAFLDDPVSEEYALNYHLMHPGGDSSPGDPNAGFYLDGIYHLHYILRHPWGKEHSFSFVHVTSPDMVYWTWKKTKLQPSFTGHGMYSGTGFVTKEGKPAIIYHGQGSGRNWITIARDRNLSGWEKPYSLKPKTVSEKIPEIRHWDPDCFLIGDTYYAIFGGSHQPLFKSKDLVNWIYVHNFLRNELPEVVIGEDISCPNFFPLGDKWMLLCISHPFGCRYYIGDWDVKNEKFIPQIHNRMNWRRPNQSLYQTVYQDFFAPESVLTPDGRRVMWAWLRTLDEEISRRTIQSLPREISLSEDGSLRICPIRELESLRFDPIILKDITVSPPRAPHSNTKTQHIIDLEGDAYEIKITIDRDQVDRKRFGIQLFAEEDQERGGHATGDWGMPSDKNATPIMIHPETGTLRIGDIEAPFSVSNLSDEEDLTLRIFIDKYLVEVFANNRQSVVGVNMNYRSANGLNFYTYGDATVIRKFEIWKLKATNQGFFEARENQIWSPVVE